MPQKLIVMTALLLALSGPTLAEVPSDYLQSLQAAARAADPAFSSFSASRGQGWFNARHGTDWSCSTCHTENPLAAGRHATTGRPIAPLAPAANPARLTDVDRIEKWFRRNCNDVIGRACTPAEKGDVLAYLTSLKR
jgi:mono/diheme cytochrome c family protein